MTDTSRQLKAYNSLMEIFFKLIDTSKKIPNKEDLKAELHEIFEYPVVKENLIQAFSNFMWELDNEIERQVYDELEGLMNIIPKIADPENVNTLIILANLQHIISAGAAPTEELGDDEVNSLVDDEEIDNTPIAGLGGHLV